MRHFVPIIGYDGENIYVHNPSIEKPEKNLAIHKIVFERARKAEGNDEDILIISNNI